MVLRSLFGRAPSFCLPGERVYAIGDVHGRIDCLERLLTLIREDHDRRGGGDIGLVLLGDLVDRGPESRAVVDRARRLSQDIAPTVILTGNHEELLLRSSQGDKTAVSVFDRAGGRETLISYGVDPADYDHCALADLPELIGRVVPATDLAFLASLDDWHVRGEYVFVHAGVRPGLSLDEQVTEDLRWIREPFLGYSGSFGAMIVHGHTITPEPDVRPNRIGIDTGAFRSGVLTAIGLEEKERWFLATDGNA